MTWKRRRSQKSIFLNKFSWRTCIFFQSFVLNWVTTSLRFNVMVSEGPIPQCAAGMNSWKNGKR